MKRLNAKRQGKKRRFYSDLPEPDILTCMRMKNSMTERCQITFRQMRICKQDLMAFQIFLYNKIVGYHIQKRIPSVSGEGIRT